MFLSNLKIDWRNLKSTYILHTYIYLFQVRIDLKNRDVLANKILSTKLNIVDRSSRKDGSANNIFHRDLIHSYAFHFYDRDTDS